MFYPLWIGGATRRYYRLVQTRGTRVNDVHKHHGGTDPFPRHGRLLPTTMWTPHWTFPLCYTVVNGFTVLGSFNRTRRTPTESHSGQKKETQNPPQPNYKLTNP